MKRVLIGSCIFIVYLGCVIAAAFVLHFSGSKFALFCVVLGLLGGATIAFAIWYMSRVTSEAAPGGGGDSINLDALLRDANRKLLTSRLGIKSLAAAQVIYLVGEDNSAKTQTILQSGLDAELLAGNVFRDGMVAPTQLANIWLSGSSVIVEAGGALLQQPALWQRLMRATRPGKLGSIFAKSGSQPPRSVVVCVSAERVPGPSEVSYNADQIRTSAQNLNERLRQLSQTLGISVPVYVLFTKLDTLPHFGDYVGRLSPDEVNAPLGSLVAPLEAGTGLFAERASALLSTRLDELTYALSEFRIEVLSRGGDLKLLASSYEFPRDLQKRRSTIVDFLVELTRPSQLGINPFLRGFFFSGMRAVLVEEISAAPAQSQASMPGDIGATGIFSFGGAQMNQTPQRAVRSSSRKIPQWAFLPHLFAKLFLSDKSALDASRVSTNADLPKRALLAFVCSCIFIYTILLTISFFNNRDIAQQVSTIAAVPFTAASPTQFASTHDLQTLDQLGTLLLQLHSYRKNGAPLMDHWGLYSIDALYPYACAVYATKFQALLLSPTQSNILSQLRSVQLPPAADADYGATYRPLAAYLITTSNPDKSTSDFLPPALFAAWSTTATPAADIARLAETQFHTYAYLRADPQSCLSAIGRPDADAVEHARIYLKAFDVYQSMLAAANRRFPSIRFNDKYSGSARYIVDGYEVKGAYTKDGFAVMQDNIQHLDKYFAGEKWVLDQQAGPVDTNSLSAQLERRYVTDYIVTWRSYLAAAHFVAFQNWKDADAKLSILDSPSSPILQLFSLISTNTGVALPDISNAFQAPQAVVPSTSPPNRPKANSNDPYISALVTMAGAVKSMADNTLTQADPAAAIPVQQAATQADQVVVNLRNGFTPDPEGKMDATSFARLEDPINSVIALAKAAPSAAAGGGAKAFCEQARDVLTKFPFNPQSNVDAPPDEVAQIFAPGQALDQLTNKISQLIVLQGSQFVPNSGTTVVISPAFLRFLSAAKKVQTDLFSMGGNPTLAFSLTEVKNPGTPVAILNIDGQQLTVAGQSAPFHWVAKPGSRITLISEQSLWTGTWSVFKFGYDGYSNSHSSAGRLEYRFPGEISRTVQFDIDGPGTTLLDSHFMSQLQHCVAIVGK